MFNSVPITCDRECTISYLHDSKELATQLIPHYGGKKQNADKGRLKDLVWSHLHRMGTYKNCQVDVSWSLKIVPMVEITSLCMKLKKWQLFFASLDLLEDTLLLLVSK
jgi:hypothetical protein